MVLRVDADVFHGVQKNGLSQPAQMWCTVPTSRAHIDAIVKFRASLRYREFSLISELISSLFATDLGLITPAPLIVNLEKETVEAFPVGPALSENNKDIMRRSVGLNFASTFAGPAFKVVPEDVTLHEPLRPIASEIFAFDIIVRNLDRKRTNPNLLWDGKKLVLIDHEAAFQGVRDGNVCDVNAFELDKFYDHVLFCAIDRASTNFERLCGALQSITPERLTYYAEQVPPDWSGAANDAQKVVDYLAWVILNRERICALIFDRIA